MPHPTTKPQLGRVLRFRCPYCGETPLRRTWFTFAPGCPQCDFAFERELGYSNAASGLIAFPSICVAGFVMAGLLLAFATGLDWVLVVSLTSVAMIAFGAWFFPYALAIWLWLEHRLHPLDANDRFPQLPELGDAT